MVKSKTSRLEVDVKRLLSKCEEMANTNDDEESWRLSKVWKQTSSSFGIYFPIFFLVIIIIFIFQFVEAVDEMIVNLQNSPM